MNIAETVVLGVVSGICTTALLYLTGLLARNHLFPWYQNFTYKGVDVNGVWVASVTSSTGIHGQMEMTIKQNAHNLRGDATIVQGKDPENPSQVTSLNLDGHMWEGFMTLNQQSKDRTRLSYSTSLLQVLNGGLRLKGVYCYRSIQSDNIESLEVVWSRKEQSRS